jgi:microsomal dipeptidase-like Zn-dependent dipeptidase
MAIRGRVGLWLCGMLAALSCSSEENVTSGQPIPGSSASSTSSGAVVSSGSTSSSGSSGTTVPKARGYADLHLHMMAEAAFGGAWMHGAHNSPLVDCDGGLPPSSHARLRQNLSQMLDGCPNRSAIEWAAAPVLNALFSVGGAVASDFVGRLEGSQGDTGLHLKRSKANDGFPRWDTIAHHQSWEGWLKKAHQEGLSLVVMSAVSFKFLCDAMPEQNRKRACSEVADIDLQLDMAREFQTRNQEWVEIALTPADARRIVAAGKLCMILSIEASNVFDEAPDWRATLQRFYGKGVRTLQMVHQLDNRFSGAALHNSIFHVAQYTKNCRIDTDCGLTTGKQTLGFDVDAACRNTRGLSEEGRAFTAEMMKLGMPIDVAHISEKGTSDVFELAKANSYYPMYVSHGHFREVMNPELAKNEKTTPVEVIRMLRQTGGIFGLRTAHDETRDYTRSSVKNDCHGSSKSFIQAWDFGRLELKMPMALGSDFNGFIQQIRPRFGELGACSAGFEEEATVQRNKQAQRVGTKFDEQGLAHVGMLSDLLKDVKNLGADMTVLDESTERYIRMWERATSVRTGPADEANDISTGNVAAYVPKDVRKAALK